LTKCTGIVTFNEFIQKIIGINALYNCVQAYEAYVCLTLVPGLITWKNLHYKLDINISNKKILHCNY